MNKLIFALAVLAVPTIANAQDRVSLLSAVERWCATTMLSDLQAIDGLAISWTTLPAFCSCVASQLTSTLSDSEIRAIHVLPVTNDVWQKAGQFCKAALMR